jgi:hypothetical protein
MRTDPLCQQRIISLKRLLTLLTEHIFTHILTRVLQNLREFHSFPSLESFMLKIFFFTQCFKTTSTHLENLCSKRLEKNTPWRTMRRWGIT